MLFKRISGMLLAAIVSCSAIMPTFAEGRKNTTTSTVIIEHRQEAISDNLSLKETLYAYLTGGGFAVARAAFLAFAGYRFFSKVSALNASKQQIMSNPMIIAGVAGTGLTYSVLTVLAACFEKLALNEVSAQIAGPSKRDAVQAKIQAGSYLTYGLSALAALVTGAYKYGFL